MADEVLTLRLTGIAGFCKGIDFVIEEGGEATIGRSRNASLRITGKEDASDRPTGGRETHLLTVSGVHVCITFKNSHGIYIEDLSKHGTFLDGKRISGRDQIIGLGKGPLELRLGTNETFRLELARAPARAQPKITVKRPAP